MMTELDDREQRRLRNLSDRARAEIEASKRPLQPLPDSLGGVAMPPAGDYPCINRCGNRTTLPGVCAACVQRAELAARKATLRRARESVPEFWRWAQVGSSELTERLLGGTTLRAQRAEVSREQTPEARAMLPEIDREIRKTEKKVPTYIDRARRVLEEHHLLVLLGDSGVGKTSLATALLQEIIEAGEHASDTRALDRARLARFLDAGSIHKLADIRSTVGDKPDVEDLDFFEKRARVLVIDNLGFELNGCPPGTPLAAMRIEASTNLVSTRIAKKRDTIITMWMPRQEVTRVYGGGFSRLLFEVGPWAIELPRAQVQGGSHR